MPNSFLSAYNFKPYDDTEQFHKDLSEISKNKRGKFLILRKDGRIGETHVFKFIYEKARGIFTKVSLCDHDLIGLRIAETLEFGASKGWLKNNDLNAIETIAKRAGLDSKQNKEVKGSDRVLQKYIISLKEEIGKGESHNPEIYNILIDNIGSLITAKKRLSIIPYDIFKSTIPSINPDPIANLSLKGRVSQIEPVEEVAVKDEGKGSGLIEELAPEPPEKNQELRTEKEEEPQENLTENSPLNQFLEHLVRDKNDEILDDLFISIEDHFQDLMGYAYLNTHSVLDEWIYRVLSSAEGGHEDRERLGLFDIESLKKNLTFPNAFLLLTTCYHLALRRMEESKNTNQKEYSQGREAADFFKTQIFELVENHSSKLESFDHFSFDADAINPLFLAELERVNEANQRYKLITAISLGVIGVIGGLYYVFNGSPDNSTSVTMGSHKASPLTQPSVPALQEPEPCPGNITEAIPRIVTDPALFETYKNVFGGNAEEFGTAIVGASPNAYEFLSKSFPDSLTMAWNAVNGDGLLLKYVAHDLIKKGLSEGIDLEGLAIAQNPKALEFATNERKLLEIQKDGLKLKFVGENDQNNPDIAIPAIAQNSNAYRFAGPSIKSDEILSISILQKAISQKDPFLFSSVPEEIRNRPENFWPAFKEMPEILTDASKELQLEAVKTNSKNYQYIGFPANNDKEIFFAAIEKGDLAQYQYAGPMIKGDFELAQSLIKENPSIYSLLIPDFKGLPEIFWPAFKINPFILKDAPINLMKEAVSKNGLDLQYAGNGANDPHVVGPAVKNNPEAILLAGEEIYKFHHTIVENALSRKGALLGNPKLVRFQNDPVMCRAAFRDKVENFRFCKSTTKNYSALARECMAIDQECLAYVDTSAPGYADVAFDGVSSDGLTLRYVPKPLQTLRIVQAAYDQNPQSWAFVDQSRFALSPDNRILVKGMMGFPYYAAHPFEAGPSAEDMIDEIETRKELRSRALPELLENSELLETKYSELLGDSTTIRTLIRNKAKIPVFKIAKENIHNDPITWQLAMEDNIDMYQYGSERLRDTRAYLDPFYAKKPSILQHATEKVKREILRENGLALKNVGGDSQNNAETALIGIENNFLAYEFIGPELETRPFLLQVIDSLKKAKENGKSVDGLSSLISLIKPSPSLIDEDVVLAFVELDGMLLEHFDKRFQNNRNIVDKAVDNKQAALRYSPTWKNDKQYVLSRITSKDCSILDDAGDNLLNSYEFFQDACGVNPQSLEKASFTVKKAFIINNGGQNFKYVGKVPLAEEVQLLKEAIKTYPEAILEASPQIYEKHKGLVKEALGRKGILLGDPKLAVFQKDLEMADVAVNDDIEAFQFVKTKEQAKDLTDLTTYSNLAWKCVNRDPECLRWVPDSTLEYDNIVLAAVSSNGLSLRHASQAARGKVPIVQAAVNNTVEAWKYAGSNLIRYNDSRGDVIVEEKSLLRRLVSYPFSWIPTFTEQETATLPPADELKQLRSDALDRLVKDPSLLQTDFKTLQGDRETARQLLPKNPMALKDFAEAIRRDPKMVRLSVDRKIESYQYASDFLRNNHEFFYEYYEKVNPLIFQFVGDQLQNEFLSQNGRALQYAGDRAQDNPDKVDLAVDHDPRAYQYASEDRRNDLDLSIKAFLNIFKFKGPDPRHELSDAERLEIFKSQFEFLGNERRQDPSFYLKLIDALKEAKDAKQSVPTGDEIYKSIDTAMRKNKAIRLKILDFDGLALKAMDNETRKTPEYILRAAKQNPEAISFNTKKNDADYSDFLIECRKELGDTLGYDCWRFAGKEALDDFDFLNKAYDEDPKVLEIATDSKKIEFLKRNGLDLEFMGKEAQGSEVMVLTAMNQNLKAVKHSKQFVEDKKFVSTHIHQALKENPFRIGEIDETIIPNYESLLLKAVSSEGLAIFRVPKKYWTNEIRQAAIENDPTVKERLDQALNNDELNALIKQTQKERELARNTVRANGMLLTTLKRKQKDDQGIVETAFSQNPHSLKEASKRLQRQYVAENPMNLAYVNEEVAKEEKTVKQAFLKYPLSLKHAGLKLRDDVHYLCELFDELKALPESEQKKLPRDGELGKFIGANCKKDYKVVQTISEWDPLTLQHFPDFQDCTIEAIRSLFFNGIRNNFETLSISPFRDNRHIILDLIQFLSQFPDIKKDGSLIKHIDPKLKKDRELNQAFMEWDGLSLKNADPIWQDDSRMVWMATSQNTKAEEFVGEGLKNKWTITRWFIKTAAGYFS